MARVLIAGGSIAGLATALALAKQGRDVLVLERGEPPPDGPAGEAGQLWHRPTVPSFLHAHTLTSLGVRTLLTRAPEVIKGALDDGATLLDLTAAMPPNPPGRQPGDDELVSLACRRPTLEVVLYRIAAAMPGVEIRHGTRVAGLGLAGDRVDGVITDGGERLPAEIVIDATGRRAEARTWLAAAGIPLAPDRTSATTMRIYSRFYRRLGQTATLNRGNAAGVLGDHYASVLHPGDSRSFSVAIGVLPEDSSLTSLRQVGSFTAAARVTPGVMDWLGPEMSTPTSEIRPITCPPNLLRTLAIEQQPVAGLFPVGDAACVTNPMYGRGISLACTQAFLLADLLEEVPEPGEKQTVEAARIAAELLQPWFDQSTVDDHDRIARWRAAISGEPAPPTPTVTTMRMVAGAAAHDAIVWRGLIRVLMGLRQPAEVFGDPDFAGRVRDVLAANSPRPMSPSRAELLAAVGD